MTDNAEIYQGDDRSLSMIVWADAAKTIPASLAGCTAEYRVGHKNTGTLLLRITGTPNAAGSWLSIIDPTNGVIQINLGQGDTSVLAARKHTHQLKVIDSTGRVQTVNDGFLTVVQTIPST